MAIQFNGNRNVAQQSKPAQRVAQRVADEAQANAGALKLLQDARADVANWPAPPATGQRNVTRGEFDALKAEVAALRELIARQAVAPAQKSRAEYYREYRKRPKPS